MSAEIKLASAIAGLVAEKRALGYTYVCEERALARFDAFCASEFPRSRLITRRGFGYHSPWAVIALAMLSLAGLCPPLPGPVTPPTVAAGDSFQGVLYSPGFFEFVARLTAQWVGRETAQPPSPEQVKQRPAQLQIGCRIPRAAAGDPSGPS